MISPAFPALPRSLLKWQNIKFNFKNSNMKFRRKVFSQKKKIKKKKSRSMSFMLRKNLTELQFRFYLIYSFLCVTNSPWIQDKWLFIHFVKFILCTFPIKYMILLYTFNLKTVENHGLSCTVGQVYRKKQLAVGRHAHFYTSTSSPVI